MLLKKKGLQYDDVLITRNPEKRHEMIARSGGNRSVPQIFICETAVGGFDELYMLEKSGELDRLLGVET